MSATNKYGLTAQQEKFAQEVAKGEMLTNAYKAAYPKSKSWLPKSVNEKASALASNIKVLSRIEVLRDKVESAAMVSHEKLLREIARLAFSDPRRLVTKSGAMVPLQELDSDTAAAIASVEVDEYGKVKYKLWDKGPAQERLAKYLGLYEKDNKQRTDALVTVVKLVALQGREVGETDESDS